MSDAPLKIKVAEWVKRAEADPVAYQLRQTVEVTLNAIAITVPLNTKLFLKGGILMGLAYNSPRQTLDIDMTTNFTSDDNVDDEILEQLNSALPRAIAALGYANLLVKASSVKRLPSTAIFKSAEFPALKLKIVSALRNTKQEIAFYKGKAPCVIDLDISYNEPLKQIQVLELTGGQELLAYSLVDLIAEKYRAMLQQVPRNRYRRQDIYDLNLLIEENQINDACREQILEAFIEKCHSRNLDPTQGSLDDSAIKERASAEWQTMSLELGELPNFEECFECVSKFYRNLPWDSK